MLNRIGDCCRRTNVETAERESIEAQVTDDRGEVSDSSFKAEIQHVSLGESHPANVVTDDAPSETD